MSVYNTFARHIMGSPHDVLRGTHTMRRLKELEESQWWPRERIEELQSNRLRLADLTSPVLQEGCVCATDIGVICGRDEVLPRTYSWSHNRLVSLNRSMCCLWHSKEEWGATTHEGLNSVRRLYMFENVLSMGDMIIAVKSEPDGEDYRNVTIDRDTWWRQLVTGPLGE